MNKESSKVEAIWISLLILFISLVYCIFISPQIIELDDIWMYAFSYNIKNGMVPYKDFNMIQTPLSAYAIALLLFFKEHIGIVIAFRIIGVWLICIEEAIILKKIIVLNFKSLLLFSLVQMPIYLAYLPSSYEIMALSSVFAGIITFLYTRNEKKRDILSAFLIFISFYSKQTTGMYGLIVILLFYFLKKKNVLRFIITYAISMSIGLGVCYYLFSPAFFEYVFGGISNFEHSKLYLLLVLLVHTIEFIFIQFLYFQETKNNKKIHKDNKDIVSIVIIAGLLALSMIPIPSVGHYVYVLCFYVFEGLIIIYSMLSKYDISRKILSKVEKYGFLLIVLAVVSILITTNIKTKEECISMTEKCCKGFITRKIGYEEKKEIYSQLEDINISLDDTIFFGLEAPFFCLNNNCKFEKYYYLPLEGNMGKITGYDLIKDTHKYVIINSSLEHQIQMDDKAFEYIKEHDMILSYGDYAVYSL